ncbi:hypothetical protein CALVIDRAFT_397655 [Calocera viscosa TUFC12733]|uniref:Uncharacterized protein n=1 Tax=Calocera viscosa (strain TUFC12733) TaxID=1330018 RepID=A0A167PRB5_CALVF|nr:hypothetical protein CALVIDRAFT_397655 [Calocera viscosa TUFC12733]
MGCGRRCCLWLQREGEREGREGRKRRRKGEDWRGGGGCCRCRRGCGDRQWGCTTRRGRGGSASAGAGRRGGGRPATIWENRRIHCAESLDYSGHGWGCRAGGESMVEGILLNRATQHLRAIPPQEGRRALLLGQKGSAPDGVAAKIASNPSLDGCDQPTPSVWKYHLTGPNMLGQQSLPRVQSLLANHETRAFGTL